MGKRYLIDSNAIIDFCNGKLPIGGKNFLATVEPEISIITNMELFAAKSIAREEWELLKKFVSITTVHPVDASLLETTIRIRQDHKLKLPDAIIAATAITFNLTLVSRNISDFRKIPGIQLIDPHNV